jgi:hypothetical protein
MSEIRGRELEEIMYGGNLCILHAKTTALFNFYLAEF